MQMFSLLKPQPNKQPYTVNGLLVGTNKNKTSKNKTAEIGISECSTKWAPKIVFSIF